LTLVDDGVYQPVIVNILTNKEAITEGCFRALLLEMLLFVDLRVGDQRLLCDGGDRHDQQQNNVQEYGQQRLHGFPLMDKGFSGLPFSMRRLAPPLPQ
jgi:hypothetical protein